MRRNEEEAPVDEGQGQGHVLAAGSDAEESDGGELTLRAAQAAVDATIRALGGYWPPLSNLARLFEECGELARAVNQGSGHKRVKAGEAPASAREELGDALYVLLVLANSLGVDASEALADALAKARRRAELEERPPAS